MNIEFQSRNRETSIFNYYAGFVVTHWVKCCFNLAIEKLLFSTPTDRRVESTSNIVSISQSRNFYFQRGVMTHFTSIPISFQSRNRETSIFNCSCSRSQLPSIPMFQSRNRETSIFNATLIQYDAIMKNLGVSISQSRNFYFQQSGVVSFQIPEVMFQSRNRETSIFNLKKVVLTVEHAFTDEFQSRNRETSIFNLSNLQTQPTNATYEFQSRNRETSIFNLNIGNRNKTPQQTAKFQSRNFYFQLHSITRRGAVFRVSISQSRNFYFQR